MFSGRKNPEHKSTGRDFKLGSPESEISGSLKKLKPEKIGPWENFIRHIHVLVILQIGKGRSALGSNDYPFNTIQYNTTHNNATQRNATQRKAIQYNTIQYNTIQSLIAIMKDIGLTVNIDFFS